MSNFFGKSYRTPTGLNESLNWKSSFIYQEPDSIIYIGSKMVRMKPTRLFTPQSYFRQKLWILWNIFRLHIIFIYFCQNTTALKILKKCRNYSTFFSCEISMPTILNRRGCQVSAFRFRKRKKYILYFLGLKFK